MQFVYPRDCISDLPSRLTLGACAEQRVDHYPGTIGLARRENLSYGFHCIGGSAFFGEGIGGLRLDCLHDRHVDARSCQRSCDDPAISPVIPRAGEHNRPTAQLIAVPTRNLLGSSSPCTLHQDARRSSSLNGPPIALR